MAAKKKKQKKSVFFCSFFFLLVFVHFYTFFLLVVRFFLSIIDEEKKQSGNVGFVFDECHRLENRLLLPGTYYFMLIFLVNFVHFYTFFGWSSDFFLSIIDGEKTIWQRRFCF